MRKLIVCGLLATFTALAGCGGGAGDAPELAPASGTVLYNDKPISGATVTFIIEGKPLATGLTNAEGKFTITTGGRPGAPVGSAKVSIAKASAAAVDMSAMKPEDMAKMAQENRGAMPTPKSEIPLKFGDPVKGGLVATVGTDGAQNVFEFRLVD